MQQSWSDRCQSSSISKVSSKLKIEVNYKTDDQKANDINKTSKVPLHILYERDPEEWEDMILTNGDNKKKLKKRKSKKRNPKNRGQFVLNLFSESLGSILFECIIQFTDSQTSIQFMKCCTKYGRILNTKKNSAENHIDHDIDNKIMINHDLLRFWKQIYTQDFGKLVFRPKRRATKTKSAQMEEFKDRKKDHLYWKQQYDIKWGAQYNKNNNFQIQYDLYKLTIKPQNYPQSNNTMTIITKHFCKKKDLLNIDNFVWSNWYDTEEGDNYNHDEIFGDRYISQYSYFYRRRRSKRKYLWVDEMMRNIRISQNEFSFGNVFQIKYTPFTQYYLDKVLPIQNGDGLEQRQCQLKSIENKKKLINGFIFNRIVPVRELKLKMKEFKRKQKKLMVLVYAMEFSGANNIKDNIVVDYFEEDF